MSKMNKYIIIFLALLIACMSISTAADVNNSTDETSVSADVPAVSADVPAVSADVPAVSVDVQTHSASDNNVIKNNKNLKSENEYDGITITQSNYNTYFDSNGNTTSQLDGHTKIRFSGELNIDQSLIIDRALNITSTEDGIIKLNTVAGSLYGNDSGNSFTINEGGSNSNITGLKFYNTQVFVKNAENVVLNGINVTVENQTIGSGVGVTSIRDGSSNVTVKNSYFYTKNNGGSSTLVLAGASYSTLDNNTIVGSGNVGNLLYLTTYNVNGVSVNDIELNSYNNITNNTITRPDDDSNITWGITLTGHDNLIANNIVNIYGQGITTQWGYIDPATPEIGDNSERYKGNFYINNTVNNAAIFKATNNSTIENNTFTGVVTTGANSTLVNNTISAKVTAQSGSSLYNNTIFDGVLINTKNVRLIGNNISKTVNMIKNDVYLEHNHICGEIKLKTGLSNITVINNILCVGYYNDIVPTTENNNTHCGSDCTANTCMCSHTTSNNNKNLKQDDNNTILITKDNVDEYYEILNVDGELVSESGGKPYETGTITRVERANKGKTYLIDSSAIAKMGHGSIWLSAGFVDVVGVGKPTIRVNSFSASTSLSNFTIRLIADPEDEEILPSLRLTTNKDSFDRNITYENLTIEYDLETTTTSIVNLTQIGRVYGYNSSDFEIKNTLTLRNSEIKCSFPTENINWGGANRPYIVPIVIIKGVSNVTIENCNITLEESSYGQNYSTMWGIYNLQNNTKIINNNINITGHKYLYAIENTVSNTNISGNNITVNGTHYTAGVYITGANMQNNIVENNNITLYSGYGHAGDNGLEEDSGYAVVIEDRAYGGFMYGLNQGSDVYNNRIINNNITTYGNNPYSIEHFGGKNTTIAGNNITAVGSNPSAIAFTGVNSVIENNTIVSLAQTNQTGTTVDHFPAVSTGIYLQYSYNTTVKNNVITTENCTSLLANSYDSLNISKNIIQSTDDYGVTLIRVNNSFVTENDIQSRTFKADASVSDNNGNNNVIENNTPAEEVQTYSLKVDTTEFNIGETTAITASIYKGDEVDSTISKGKVVFKVNGKTLKDANGKVIYAKVTGGVATITDYEVPSSWAKDNITIQAVYSGSLQCEALRTSANLTVSKDTPTITTNDITASKGETVTLTATVTVGSSPVNVGRVVFKVNGKTVKDANGKVVYAKVVNGTVSVEYTLPENIKAGNYNITISFIAPGYDKLVDTKTLTVNA